MQYMLKIINTFFYAGLIPIAPGTMGTLSALIVAWFFKWDGQELLIATAIILPIGIITTSIHSKVLGMRDPAIIVIDEVAGIWLTLGLLETFFLSENYHCSEYLLHISVVHAKWTKILSFTSSFLTFRLFDIFKPWPVSYFDKHIHGGLGIMLDDIAAAVLAFISISVILLLICHFAELF